MSQILWKNSIGKVVFPFLVGNFMSRVWNCSFGRHFVTICPIFDFFALFWFFWITLSVARISAQNSFRKVLFWVRVPRDPPLTTNGSQKYLDHLSVKYAVYSELYLLSSLLEIKKVCSISSALNAQFYLFIKSRVGSDEHIYQYPSLFIVGPKIWTANKENSYFCWSRKIWLFFLIVLFIDMKNYTILLFSVSLGKICCTKLDLLQNIRKFYGQLFDMRILQGSERRPQSVGFNSKATH